ncbi:hypothetical protein [Turneriella parva]|uniref:Lipoprotein n=1 Tax=Turneriella parva (strain ATCC BAA-1111 / DSM 21527 / NCTC 11395 / H) TaxID=869212 RepID=I4B0N7_TURPD|nr:hypothetical protein [Turneriella parva]AFM10844.1 hypothetical protein Turpa_0182 [Turneriella parva DSM 21527]
MRASVYLCCLLLAAGCASAPEKPPADLQGLLAKATELREKGISDKARYEELVAAFVKMRQESPQMISDPRNRSLAADFVEAYPAVKCKLRVTEPREKLITARGFASPLFVAGTCPVPAPFMFEADSADMALSPAGVDFETPYLVARIRVNSATADAARNRLRFTAAYYAADFLKTLSAAYSLEQESLIALTPADYALQTAPIVANDGYDSHRKNFRKAEFTSEAVAGELGSEVAISASGQFSAGGTHAGKRFDLIYGHPNGTLPDGIGTTFTTVRVDGTDYRLESQKVSRSKTADGTLVCEAAIGKTGVTIVQKIKPEPAGDRVKTRITYEIRNGSAVKHKVGLRLLLDTWAGQNDGVPFMIPAGSASQLFRNEVEFTPTASVMWQVFDPDTAGTARQLEPGLQNILVGEGLVPPDRIAFAAWQNAADTLWDYAVSADRRVTGDSAVILWYNPADISAGATQVVATELGAALQKHEPTVFITNAATGEILIYLWHVNDSGAEQKIDYNVRAEKGKFTFQLDLSTIKLQPGEVYVKASPGQILAEGETAIVISENINGASREYRFPLQNLKMWKQFSAAPVVEPAQVYPVSYFDERSMNLKARLKTAGGKTVQTIILKKQQIDGGYQYSGELNIAPDIAAGRYSVEVVK